MAFDLGEAVDVHHHWIPQELVDHLADYLPDGYSIRETPGIKNIIDPKGLRVQSVFVEEFPDLEHRLQLMEEAGVQQAILSPGCYPNWITMKAARLLNDASTDVARKYGDRLKPMVNVPPYGEPGILEEMERAAKLGLTGVAATAHFGGQYVDEEAYIPFFQKAAELDLPVFIHAAGAPVYYDDLIKYSLTTPMGRSFDLCLVPLRLIMSGRLDGIPNLKVVIAHLGGFTFLNLKRFFGPPAREGHGGVTLDQARKSMERMLFDTAPAGWFGAAEIRFAISALGVERVALGSDYPHGSLQEAMDHLRGLNSDDAVKRQVAGENARAFYKL
ncbi:MAG TPA: amidohydrolase family protein [Chloroflexota bacterium]|nr:amidohydrolase family protein [Chloroflexota bacterium]